MWLQAGVRFGDITVAYRLDELTSVVEGPRAPLTARYAQALACGDGVGLAAVSVDFETMGIDWPPRTPLRTPPKSLQVRGAGVRR